MVAAPEPILLIMPNVFGPVALAWPAVIDILVICSSVLLLLVTVKYTYLLAVNAALTLLMPDTYQLFEL